MPETRKILGQLSPAAATPTDLYPVPAATQAIISSIVIANRGGTAATYRVSISAAGVATTNRDYLFYDITISKQSTHTLVIGVTLGPLDVVRVYSSNTNISFNAFGVEIT